MKAKYRKCIFRKFPIIFSRIMGKRKDSNSKNENKGGNQYGTRKNNNFYGKEKRL